MPWVAKRKLRETWRDAVALRAGPDAAAILRVFEAGVAAGQEEAEAAFRALEAAGLLWSVDEPGREAAPAEPPSGPGQ